MLTAGKKKPEEKNARPPGSKRSMGDAAEKQRARVPKNYPGVKGPTTERLVHELQVHLNEIETIAEDILKSSESRYRRFFEAVRDGILILDAETGTILDVNPFLIELLGFTHEQFLGKKLWEIGVFKDIAASKDNFKELQEKKYIHFENLPLETADGRRIYAEFVSFVYDVEDKKVMQCNIRDITERKKAEETLRERTRELSEAQDQLVTKEKLAILGKLARGVGHELRNPLGAIKNAAYFLNMTLETPDPDVKEMVELINKEVARSEDIISSLLDFFARPQTLTLTKEAFATAVNGALKRNPVPEHVTVINNLDETLPGIQADQDKLLQVFNNIISNAFQAMPEGGSLTITSKQPDPEWVSISFTDTGEGISAENMKKLFEPLFTTKIKGIGLGLVVSKTIVELHGGHIDVRSEAGKGTTVTVNLPIVVTTEV
jgi:PAS domain S-box-containing protein